MGTRARIRHVGALDGLRGVAVAGVLLFHGGHLTGGYLGVDLFFVLSGFLITTLLLVESGATGRVRLGGFWARRARRLLPALAGLLVGVAVYCVVFAAPGELHQIRGDALATIGYVANWRSIAVGQDYWALFRAPSPLGHTWSLAIEEQFYLVWPLVVFGLLAWWKRRTPQAVLVVALAGAAVSYALLGLLYDPADPSRAYFGTDTRASAVLLGAALAALRILRPPRVDGRRATRVAIEAAGIAGAAVLAVLWVTLDGQSATLYRGGLLLAGIATIAVIAAITQVRPGPLGRLLDLAPLRHLGLVSYGVYLWHWPVDIVVDQQRTGLGGYPLFLLQVAITLAIAEASYVLVEMPIRRGAISARRWAVVIPATGVVLVTVLLFVTATSPTPAEAGITLRGGAGLAKLTSRTALLRQRSLLDRAVGPTRPRVLVAGDSMATSLLVGADRSRDAPLGVANAAVIGCGIGRGVPIGPKFIEPASECDGWKQLWPRAIDVFHPRAIVLLAGVWDIWPRRVGTTLQPMYSPALRRNLLGALGRAQEIVASAGIPLVILTVPCLHPSATELQLVAEGLAEPARVRWLNGVYRAFAARHPDVRIVDLGRRTCAHPGDLEDGVHFGPAGARRAWNWLTPRLQRVIAP